MTGTKLRQQIATGFAVIALSLGATPGMRAQCRAGGHNGTATLPPEFKNLVQPDELGSEGFAGKADSFEGKEQEKDQSKATILGLWKEIYFADGTLNDVGFGHFNAGGTELINDVGALNSGNNFCIGAWKLVGPRHYEVVHPFFLFDGSGKIATGVSIERADLTVSRDGNRFSGTWTQDNYDLLGNVDPKSHFEGLAWGVRITPGPNFPFPFPY